MRAVIVLDLDALERAMPTEHQLIARVSKALDLAAEQIAEPGRLEGSVTLVAYPGGSPARVLMWEAE